MTLELISVLVKVKLCCGSKQLQNANDLQKPKLVSPLHHVTMTVGCDSAQCCLYLRSYLKQPLSGTSQIKVEEGKESMGAGPTLDVTHAASHLILAKTMINPEINRVGCMIPLYGRTVNIGEE